MERIYFPESPCNNTQISRCQQQQQQQIIRHYYKKRESMTHAEKQNTWIEMIPEEDQMPVLLDKDFRATFLKMLKGLQEDMDESGNTMYVQNRNINKETESMKGTKTNAEFEKHNRIEKSTKGIQKQI